MINEYFIEPQLIYKWACCPRDARFFLDSIGIGNTRLLSSFPKSKPSKLKGDLLRGIPEDMPEVARLRVDEFVSELTTEAITRQVPESLPIEWSDAAKEQCNKIAPDVVVAMQNETELKCWITESDAYNSGSIFNHPDQLTPERTLEGFTSSVINLLRYSSKIIIVDPYLYKSAGIDTVKAFINASQENRLNSHRLNLQLIFDASKSTADYVANELSSLVSDFDIGLDVLAVQEKNKGEKLHNRYLLTELGGVSFGVGTDVSEEYHSEDLFLLNKTTYDKRWNQYLNATAFDVVESKKMK